MSTLSTLSAMQICGALTFWTVPVADVQSAPLYAGAPRADQGCDERQNTPILIPLAQGLTMSLTSVDQGVLFDMNADGLLDWTGWTDWNSKLAFLAIDRNGNGVIDNGSELFGDHTIERARNGFTALQKMNMELNGGVPRASVNADEPLFERLLLWEDENHNGISEPHEIQPAARLLSDIGLGYGEHRRRDRHGNLLKWKGWASLRTGPGRNQAVEPSHQQARHLDIFDVHFVTKRLGRFEPLEPRYNGPAAVIQTTAAPQGGEESPNSAGQCAG